VAWFEWVAGVVARWGIGEKARCRDRNKASAKKTANSKSKATASEGGGYRGKSKNSVKDDDQ
jgi:hypothetical protein